MADLVPFSKLQEYLTGITRYRVTSARHHIKKYGRGVSLPTARSTKMRIDYSQLDHFLSFLTSPYVIRDLSFGQCYLYFSGGQTLETPNVIRTMVNQRVIDQYQQYCLETNFKPFSASIMQRILVSCSATVRKSLRGLDYLSAEGTKALEDLASIAESLTTHGIDNPTAKRLEKSSRKESNISKPTLR